VPTFDGLPPITVGDRQSGHDHDRRRNQEEKAAQALEPEPLPDWRQPPPEPEEEERRWPITQPIRDAIVVSALDLCVLRVTPEGAVETSGQTAVKPRIMLGAMRVLAGFDLLAVKQKRVKYLGVAVKLKGRGGTSL